MECSYALKPILCLSDHTISSNTGVQQGDPLGPLGFALALQPIIEKLNKGISDLLINA